MPLGFSEIFCHIVWRTEPLSPRLSVPVRRLVKQFLLGAGEKLGYEPIAVAALEDHVHLLAKILPGVAPGLLAETLKKELSDYLVEKLALTPAPQWDEGYGIVSVSPAHTEIVARYVRGQEAFHKTGHTNKTLERTRE